MAPRTTPVRKAWRSLAWLGAIIVALVLINGGGVLFAGAAPTPKLGLDLEGGTQIILEPVIQKGKTVSADQLNQAVAIIRQRVDAAGVSESQISTQGASNIVVSIPGTPDQATLQRLEASAKLDFRPVLLTGAPAAATASPSPTPGQTPAPALSTTPTAKPTNASDPSWITPALQAKYNDFQCSSLKTVDTNAAPENKPLITCSDDGSAKYILGPVEVAGDTISDATSGQQTNQQGSPTGVWVVNLTFNGKGTTEFSTVTTRLVALDSPRNQFAIVLDGKVVSAPVAQAAITDGQAQISGSFTQTSAQTLAQQLKFGALPIGFTVQSRDTISPTLGTTQLFSGIIAGLIGLILVVLYSLVQYRTLGLVTVASLAISAVITYLVVTLLGWQAGYRLSLAGVAGLIVAIGITADSFIVYFERIRDELRDGRGLESAVEAGWKRAIRTILASDTVNFLAAIILYIVAVGDVKGFALTLGLTTIFDVIVVTLFTHPLLRLLARTRFFGDGHPLSGLNPQALGAVYRGRAQFRAPAASVSAAKQANVSREVQKRMTIAERKAAEAESSKQKTSAQQTTAQKTKAGSKGQDS